MDNNNKLSEIVNNPITKLQSEILKTEENVSEELKDFESLFTIKTGIQLLLKLLEDIDQNKKKTLTKEYLENNQSLEENLNNYSNILHEDLSLKW